jgi:hypothetical protein
MESINRHRRQHFSTIETTVRRFLDRAGDFLSDDEPAFWSYLDAKFGRKYAKQLDKAVNAYQASHQPGNVYELLNRDLGTMRATYSLVAPMGPRVAGELGYARSSSR